MNHRAARRAFALASQFRASNLSPRISAAFRVTETAETDFRISLFPFVDSQMRDIGRYQKGTSYARPEAPQEVRQGLQAVDHCV